MDGSLSFGGAGGFLDNSERVETQDDIINILIEYCQIDIMY
jgi:hypothetical protein